MHTGTFDLNGTERGEIGSRTAAIDYNGSVCFTNEYTLTSVGLDPDKVEEFIRLYTTDPPPEPVVIPRALVKQGQSLWEVKNLTVTADLLSAETGRILIFNNGKENHYPTWTNYSPQWSFDFYNDLTYFELES